VKASIANGHLPNMPDVSAIKMSPDASKSHNVSPPEKQQKSQVQHLCCIGLCQHLGFLIELLDSVLINYNSNRMLRIVASMTYTHSEAYAIYLKIIHYLLTLISTSHE